MSFDASPVIDGSRRKLTKAVWLERRWDASMPDAAPDPASLYRAYRAETEGQRLVRSTRTAALVVTFLGSGFIPLDAVAYPESFRLFGRPIHNRSLVICLLVAVRGGNKYDSAI